MEERVTLLFQGVLRGRIGLERFVDLVATASAKLSGLYPRKGTIAPGSDADVVVFDPSVERTLAAATHRMNVDYSCYEGMRVRGAPELVMQRGQVLVEDGVFKGRPGAGRFLPRGRPAPLPARLTGSAVRKRPASTGTSDEDVDDADQLTAAATPGR